MTIVVDTSALACIVFGQAEANRMNEVLTNHPLIIGAPTLVETLIVTEARHGLDGPREVRELLDATEATVEPFTSAMAELAHAGWRRFGKGRHPAALNLGDCYSYAVAMALELPLLAIGDDFPRTDVILAPWSELTTEDHARPDSKAPHPDSSFSD